MCTQCLQVCRKSGRTLSYMCKCVLQGEFPDKNTQEDGYAGVAPVDAFPAQNKFGKICLINYQD